MSGLRSIQKSFLCMLSVYTFFQLSYFQTAEAAIQKGVIIAADQPLAGALVTWTSADKKKSMSVYSDEKGNFNMDVSGEGNIRVRHPLYRDLQRKLNSISEEKSQLKTQLKSQTEWQMQAFTSSEELAKSFPASVHVTKVFRNLKKESKKELIGQCFMCHQMGNALTRQKKSEEGWDLAVERMEGMGAMLTSEGRKNIPEALYKSFDGDISVQYRPHVVFQQAWKKAQIREWPIGEAVSHIHDVIVAKNGKIYGVDMSLDRIYELNRDTGAIRNWPFPITDMPLGGMFSGAYHPLGTFNAKFGPHSVQEGPEGVLWITASLSGDLLSFDPVAEKFTRYPLPEGVYPHTMRFDRKGQLWFTISVTNQVAMFNPKTKKFKIIQLPYGDAIKWVSAKLAKVVLKIASWFPEKNLQVFLSSHKSTGKGYNVLPVPYGIDVSPIDGSIWYSKLNDAKIGRIDPATFEITEFETPLMGPRRLRFASNGTLWIPAFMEGSIMSFEPTQSKFKVYKLPVLGPEQQETPYALAVHPLTGMVWITGGSSDRMIRFNPINEEFSAYPLPTRVTFMREIDFSEDGEVCSSYANLPGYAIEGGRPKIMCLRPGSVSL